MSRNTLINIHALPMDEYSVHISNMSQTWNLWWYIKVDVHGTIIFIVIIVVYPVFKFRLIGFHGVVQHTRDLQEFFNRVAVSLVQFLGVHFYVGRRSLHIGVAQWVMGWGGGHRLCYGWLIGLVLNRIIMWERCGFTIETVCFVKTRLLLWWRGKLDSLYFLC